MTGVLVTIFTVLLCLVAGVARAATFNVTTVSGFQSALTTAAANGAYDTINVAAGTYAVTTTLSYTSTENRSLVITGAGTGATILDGGSARRILTMRTTEAGADLAIKKMTFRNGSSTGNGGGLAVEADAADITVENAEFSDNDALLIGGGAHLVSSSGTVKVSLCAFRRNSGVEDAGGLNAGTTGGKIVLADCTLEDNVVPGVHPGVPAKDGGGAILYVDGPGQATMTGNTFRRNRAADGGGGCMTYLVGSGVSLTISNNAFTDNRAQLDGGGCFTRINDNGSVTYTDNTFTGNATVTAGGAGSMVHLNAGTMTFSGNTYDNNTAGEDGGGFWFWNGTGTVTVAFNTFRDNDAANNGGGCVLSSDEGTMTISKNVFETNAAVNVGGGLSYATGRGTVHVTGNTFFANQAADGGGCYLYFDQAAARPSVSNNIFWHDDPNGIAQSGATAATATYSDIEHGTGETWFGTGCIDKDPLFKNTGTGNFHLSWLHFPTPDATKSPCIDAGDPAAPQDPDNTRADMGALYFNQSAASGERGAVDKQSFEITPALLGPAQPGTLIRYSLPREVPVFLAVYSAAGVLVDKLVDGRQKAGVHEVRWNVPGATAGCYFCRFETGGTRRTGKIIVVK